MASQLYESVMKNDAARDALNNPKAAEPSPGSQASKAGREASKVMAEKNKPSATATSPGPEKDSKATAQAPKKPQQFSRSPRLGPASETKVASTQGPAKAEAATPKKPPQKFSRQPRLGPEPEKKTTSIQGPAPAQATLPGVARVIPKGDNTRVVKAGTPMKAGKAGKSGFGAAFAAARKSGAKEFTFNGKKYNTKLKGQGGTETPKKGVGGPRPTTLTHHVPANANAATKANGAPRKIHPDKPATHKFYQGTRAAPKREGVGAWRARTTAGRERDRRK